MVFYIDLKLLPDEEVPIFFIRNKVYTKLHKAIFDISATDIGVSFPQVEIKLGDVIRIHSTQDGLNKLQNLNWLGRLSGYCKVSDILPVPDKHGSNFT
jgi:CRISPR-associated endonuclease Csy4